MSSQKHNTRIEIDGPTTLTDKMDSFTRANYLIQKTVNFLWRYRKNPMYMFTYLRFITNESYKEEVHFMSDEMFIEEAKKRSTLRLQDGEFTLLLGTRDLAYEKKNERLLAMWREAIHNYSDDSPYILGLPPYILIENGKLHSYAFKYLWMPAKILYRLWFPKKAMYFNGSFFYIDNTAIPFMQSLSHDHDVILVSNKEVIDKTKPHSSLFFKGATTINYVETPDTNAFAAYDSIMSSIESLITSQTVIFMACGPAGKAMIYDLAKKNIRAHDIGYGLTGAYTGESREHFLKWDIFGPLYQKLRTTTHEK